MDQILKKCNELIFNQFSLEYWISRNLCFSHNWFYYYSWKGSEIRRGSSDCTMAVKSWTKFR